MNPKPFNIDEKAEESRSVEITDDKYIIHIKYKDEKNGVVKHPNRTRMIIYDR